MAKCEKDGRPPKYTAKQMQEKIDRYFAEMEEQHKMPSFCALALYLGYYSERALQRYVEDSSYEKSNKQDLVQTVTRARERIKAANIDALYDRDMTRGAQFVLQNGFGWSEKQEIKHDAVINVQITDD